MNEDNLKILDSMNTLEKIDTIIKRYLQRNDFINNLVFSNNGLQPNDYDVTALKKAEIESFKDLRKLLDDYINDYEENK